MACVSCPSFSESPALSLGYLASLSSTVSLLETNISGAGCLPGATAYKVRPKICEAGDFSPALMGEETEAQEAFLKGPG